MPIKSFKRSVLCIREKEKIYKILSVNASKNDGSLNVFFPYCSEKRVYIYQHKHKYKVGKSKIKRKQIIKEYLADKNTKLSIHQSGFVQLSGNGILSGVNEKTGEPKGIGVFSSPLSNPVSSGPTFGFQCWGLENGFEVLTEKVPGCQYIILDSNNDIFNKRVIIKNNKFNSYILEFFIFPEEANKFVFEYKKEPYINHIISNYMFNPGALFTHPVLDLKFFKQVLCVFPNLMFMKGIENVVCGYMLGSPGGSNCITDKSKTGYNFCIVCPRDKKIEGLNIKNIEI
jgi:hypothetical protein